jgi:hypothetical protein
VSAPDARTAQKMVGMSRHEDGFDKNTLRPKGDAYASPPIATVRLLEARTFGKRILEPCCGNGAISKVLVDRGYDVTSRDLYDWGYGTPNMDFLTTPAEPFDAVITNPPFKIATDITLKGLECVKSTGGPVAILNRLAWFEGKDRAERLLQPYLLHTYIFKTRIPRTHRFDYTGKKGTSLIAFAWFIFGHDRIGKSDVLPTVSWILGGKDQ